MSNHHDDARDARSDASAAREAVREKAEQVKTKQARARVARIAAIAVVLVAVIAAVAVVVTLTVSRDVTKPKLQPAVIEGDGIQVTKGAADLYATLTEQTPTPEPSGTATPSAAATEATPEPTRSSKPVEVRVYLDYLSEGAGQFQTTNAEQLAELVRSGAITLTYHPVAMLTANSNGTKYSLRAAGAAACVATFAPDGFLAFNTSLLKSQPQPESDGYSDAELGDMAAAVVGKSDAGKIRSCITDGTYLSWVKAATERALKDDLPGTKDPLAATPTVLVDGTAYVGSLKDAAEFQQSIMDAESNAYFQSGTPTPTPEPTDATPTPAATEPAPTPTPTS